MTLDECLNKSIIIEEYSELNLSMKGVNKTFRVGDTIGNLTIVKLVRFKSTKNSPTRKGCICKCSCGNFIGPSRLVSLVNGDLVSCGCYQRKIHSKIISNRNKKHGFSSRNNRDPLYVIWGTIKDRTTNLKRKDSKYYSKKGISICDDWKNNFPNFRNWAIKNGYKEGLSIDRIDNSKGYCPENCRWISKSLQNNNKTNNRFLTYKGVSKTITQWGRERNLGWNTINRRLKKGKSIGQALGFEN